MAALPVSAGLHDYSAFNFTNPLTDKAYVQTMGGIKNENHHSLSQQFGKKWGQ